MGLNRDKLENESWITSILHTRGVEPQQKIQVVVTSTILHTRGVEPSGSVGQVKPENYSPHTWGWTENGDGMIDTDHLFSTHVGLNRPYNIIVYWSTSILHTRGIEPLLFLSLVRDLPILHTRGVEPLN